MVIHILSLGVRVSRGEEVVREQMGSGSENTAWGHRVIEKGVSEPAKISE